MDRYHLRPKKSPVQRLLEEIEQKRLNEEIEEEERRREDAMNLEKQLTKMNQDELNSTPSKNRI